MENTEKVEIGYTVPKERWQEAAENLEELGNVLAAGFLKQNKDGRGKEDAEKPPASPQCTDCPLWKYGAVSCARFNLRYALNEMLKELPFFCRTAEGKIVCPHKEAKK